MTNQVKGFPAAKGLRKRRRKMDQKEQLYEGKAKKVFATDDPDLCIVSYKDDATAFNGQKRERSAVKGLSITR